MYGIYETQNIPEQFYRSGGRSCARSEFVQVSGIGRDIEPSQSYRPLYVFVLAIQRRFETPD